MSARFPPTDQQSAETLGRFGGAPGGGSAEPGASETASRSRRLVRCWRCEFKNGVAADEQRPLVYCEWCDAPVHPDGHLPHLARRLWFLIRSRFS